MDGDDGSAGLLRSLGTIGYHDKRALLNRAFRLAVKKSRMGA